MIIQKQELPNGEIFEVVIIDNNDGSITSMPKEYYEQLEANKVEHLTEIPTN